MIFLLCVYALLGILVVIGGLIYTCADESWKERYGVK